MKLPKLKIRPVSQQSCTKFGGIDHHPTAPIGGWWDSRNLTSDKSPTICARNGRSMHASIDGNSPDVPIVAMCGGDHLVLLDETGTFWCNGHSQQVTFPYDNRKTLAWYWIIDKSRAGGDVNVTVSPKRGFDSTWTQFNGIGVDALNQTVTADRIVFRCASDDPPGPVWECDFGTYNPRTWTEVDLSDYNIEIEGDNYLDRVEVELWQFAARTTLLNKGHRLVRMGAKVIDPKSHVWIDAVKLAAGETMTEDVDYGSLDATNSDVYSNIFLELCDVDGNSYSGVTVSATEPAQQGYWLDISDSTPALREWSVSSSTWIRLTSTYVKIYADDADMWDGINVFDTVKLDTLLPNSTASDVESLLNSWQYIYGEVTESSFRKLIVAGILSSSSVTVTNTGTLTVTVSKTVPDMDYVVESGNRLWGCRYSESDHINEIYASKLGDPTNWHVFQGLSTDSWTASRGTAAPFTGAAVLDGHPLFFREESVEKIYPSAAGAHQIQTFDLEGVENGAADSLVVIDDRLYYKSRGGVMVYTGSVPRRISEAFGDMVFRGGSAGRHHNKYCLSTTLKGEEDEDVVLVLDLTTGDWHIEDEAWYGLPVTWKDDLYYIDTGTIESMAEGAVYGRVAWWAETAPQAIRYGRYAGQSLTEHKWISYLRVRFRMLASGSRIPNKFRIYIAYDGGDWQLLKEYTMGASPLLTTFEMNLMPRRKDNFRLRFEGEGPAQIYDVAWRVERSEGGH